MGQVSSVSVKADFDANNVTVVDKVVPVKNDRSGEKTKKRGALISPQPKKEAAAGGGDKKPEEKKPEKKKAKEKKLPKEEKNAEEKKPPKERTDVLQLSYDSGINFKSDKGDTRADEGKKENTKVGGGKGKDIKKPDDQRVEKPKEVKGKTKTSR